MIHPPVLVISRKQDTDRRDWIEENYQRKNVNFTFFDAVDGHTVDSLRPFQALIADKFWNTDTVKPGALGAFFSHYSAWQQVVRRGYPIIIAEDDSHPVETPSAVNIACPDDAELVFINNRLASWVKPTETSVMAVSALAKDLQSRFEASPFRAPGADAYYLSVNGAKKLVDLTHQFGTICGVDWFMIAMTLPIQPSMNQELNIIYDQIGAQNKHVNGYIKRNFLFNNYGKFPSALIHKNKMNITELKSKIS